MRMQQFAPCLIANSRARNVESTISVNKMVAACGADPAVLRASVPGCAKNSRPSRRFAGHCRPASRCDRGIQLDEFGYAEYVPQEPAGLDADRRILGRCRTSVGTRIDGRILSMLISLFIGIKLMTAEGCRPVFQKRLHQR